MKFISGKDATLLGLVLWCAKHGYPMPTLKWEDKDPRKMNGIAKKVYKEAL